MKKKDLKSLKLNKKSISNFQVTNSIKGASGIRCILPLPGSVLFDCDDTSEAGCPTTPDETMTCPDWSCGCPQN